MKLSRDSGTLRCPRSLAALVVAAAAVGSLLLPAAGAIVRAQTVDPGPDTEVYLEQLQPVLADAQSSLNDLQYYLPVASVSDPNDPTWGLAQQASDTVGGDADLIGTLSPPDALTPANDALIAALKASAADADDAIEALSSGDLATGQAQVLAFDATLTDLAKAEAGLPPGFDPGTSSSP